MINIKSKFCAKHRNEILAKQQTKSRQLKLKSTKRSRQTLDLSLASNTNNNDSIHCEHSRQPQKKTEIVN